MNKVEISDVKMSPNHILVNDFALLSDAGVSQVEIDAVNEFITDNSITASYTDQDILDMIFSRESLKYEEYIQNHLDSKAKEYKYDNILSACTYGIARGRFQSEGLRFAEWRTDVWDYCYTELDKVKQGTRTKPTIDEFILELPQLIL